VKILAEDGAGALSFLPIEVVAEPVSAPHAASDSLIEVALPSGHRVSASGSFDVEALCRLVRACGLSADDPLPCIGGKGERAASTVWDDRGNPTPEAPTDKMALLGGWTFADAANRSSVASGGKASVPPVPGPRYCGSQSACC